MHAIKWPQQYLPGYTDNFCSNEVIVKALDIHKVWSLLAQPSCWPQYYANSANPVIHNSNSETLKAGDTFYFETFGFPVECEVVEYQAPENEQPGRIAWHGWSGEGEDRLDVHHAWLIEVLPGDRLRILTQETQIGEPAKALAVAKPNPMINGHQEWLDGLVSAARQ